MSSPPLSKLDDAVSFFRQAIGAKSYKVRRRIAGLRGPVCEVADVEIDNALLMTLTARYYTFRKSSYFNFYESVFKQERGKGVGTSISLKMLTEAAMENANIAIVIDESPKPSVYTIEASQWLSYCKSRGTTREVNNEPDTVAGIPIKEMKKLV